MNVKTKEQAAVDFIKNIIKNTVFENKVFLAGGYVRDEILGLQSKDIDLVIDIPNGGEKFAIYITKTTNTYKQHSNPVIYKKFGTAKFTFRNKTHRGFDISNVEIECVAPRIEKYIHSSRKPVVCSGTLFDDVCRRDFTANSLLKNISTDEILDLTKTGLSDLRAGILKTPLDPKITFSDDPLRMLRAIRFSVQKKWKIDASVFKAIKVNKDRIKIVSQERIRDELIKILLTDKPGDGVRLLAETGLLDIIIPELIPTIGLKQNKYHDDFVFEHILSVLNKTPNNLIIRLGAIFHDIGKPQAMSISENGEVHFFKEENNKKITHQEISSKIAERRLFELKFSNDIIKTVSLLCANHMRLKFAGNDESKITDKALRKLRVEVGESLPLLLDLMHADNISHSKQASMPNQISNIRKRIDKLDIKIENSRLKLPMNGNDIMKIFKLSAGPVIGKLLKILNEAVLENPNLTKKEAIQLLQKEI